MAPKKTLSLRPKTNSSLDRLKEISARSKGVQAVAAAAGDITSGAAILYVPLDKIVIQSQVRKTFSEEGIDELAKSIESVGQQQPITVRMEDGNYVVVSGERRVRAMQKLGRPTIMAILTKTADAREVTLRQLVENMQREEMNPLEIGRSLNSILGEDMTIEQLATALGKSRQYLISVLSACKLPDEIAQLVIQGKFNDVSAIHRLVSLLSQAGDKAQSIINAVLKEAETVPISRSFIARLDTLINKRHETAHDAVPVPLKDVKLTPANAIRLARFSGFEHLRFPGLNVRLECYFRHPNVNGGKWYNGDGAQLITSILTEDPEKGVVEFRNRLYECSWADIQLVSASSVDRNGNPVKMKAPRPRNVKKPEVKKPAQPDHTAQSTEVSSSGED